MKHGRNTDKKKRIQIIFFSYPCFVRVSSVAQIWHRASTMSLNDTLASRSQSVTLSPQEVQRYSRHLIMPEVGVEGQKRLKAASVLLIGAGGLGSPLGLYLAAAGVGRIGLVDFDVVDYSNLQRQVIHGTKDVGRPRSEERRVGKEGIRRWARFA